MAEDTKTIIDKFEDAFQRHDPSGFAAIIAEDCVLENTGPAPDGARYVGHKACVQFWSSVAANTTMHFEEENIDVYDDRAIVRWRLFWGKDKTQSVRGVNIMRVRDGKIVEGLGYVKG